MSPVYTPFTGPEVCCALRVRSEEYLTAAAIGAIQTSVHFDGRVSKSTALHSLVDVVRFDVVFLKYTLTRLPADLEHLLEIWLDGLCELYEEDEAAALQLILEADHRNLIARLEPGAFGTAPHRPEATWDTAPTLLFDIVESWCRCFRACLDILTDDLRKEQGCTWLGRRLKGVAGLGSQ